MIIFDLPYHLLDLTWDVEITRQFMDTFLKQVIAINNCPDYVVVLYHTMNMTSMLHEALADAHFQHMTPFFWHKTAHLTQTAVSSYTQSVECGTIAFKPSRDKCAWNASKDPRNRHNFIETPSVTTYLKDTNGEVINPCQKPPAISRWLVGNHCMPGSTVLVCGAGALGDVEGAVDAGCHVIAVEKDKHQFVQSGAHLVKMAEADAKQSEKEKKTTTETATKSTKGQAKKKSSKAEVKTSQVADQDKEGEPPCIECGEPLPVGYDATIICQHCDPQGPMHESCAQRGSNNMWYCTEHLTATLGLSSPSQTYES